MFIDDFLAFAGACCFLAGVYLWLGLPAALMVGGAALIFVGARADFTPRKGNVNELNQKPIRNEQSN